MSHMSTIHYVARLIKNILKFYSNLFFPSLKFCSVLQAFAPVSICQIYIFIVLERLFFTKPKQKVQNIFDLADLLCVCRAGAASEWWLANLFQWIFSPSAAQPLDPHTPKLLITGSARFSTGKLWPSEERECTDVIHPRKDTVGKRIAVLTVMYYKFKAELFNLLSNISHLLDFAKP